MHIWAEYEVIIERKEWCHSYERHGFHVTEKFLLERVLAKGINATRFISETIHRECREVFLSVFKDEMAAALARGDTKFERTVDFRQPVGEGILANTMQWDDSVTCVKGYFVNTNGKWYERTFYPEAKPSVIHI